MKSVGQRRLKTRAWRDPANRKGPFFYDLKKYYAVQLNEDVPSFWKRLKLWLTDYGLHCVAIYRLGQFVMRRRKEHPILSFGLLGLYYVLHYFVQLIHHVDINVMADIGPGFFIAHASSIYIGACKIGKNLSIAHNVTIGIGYAANNEGLPKIGDNVWISTGSILTGAINVGDGSTIGPGCVLSKNVPPRSLVVGNPGRIVSRDFDNLKMLRYKID